MSLSMSTKNQHHQHQHPSRRSVAAVNRPRRVYDLEACDLEPVPPPILLVGENKNAENELVINELAAKGGPTTTTAQNPHPHHHPIQATRQVAQATPYYRISLKRQVAANNNSNSVSNPSYPTTTPLSLEEQDDEEEEEEEQAQQQAQARPHYSVTMPRHLDQATAFYRISSKDGKEAAAAVVGEVDEKPLSPMRRVKHKFEYMNGEKPHPAHDAQVWSNLLRRYRDNKGRDD